MAKQDLINNMIINPGQSQADRMCEALSVHYVDIDERSTADLLELIKKLAQYVRYYPSNTADAVGDWHTFFPDHEITEQWLNSLQDSKQVAPHLALILAALELYKKPQQIINRFGAEHLDFYYQKALGLQKKQALADRAHMVLNLKKNASPVLLTQNDRLSAGKDASGVELIYQPTAETVINSAQIAALKSLYIDSRERGVVRYAPIANSFDGLGADLEKNKPDWKAFGFNQLPVAEYGFALASPVLRLQEGVREITVNLTLSDSASSQLSGLSLDDIFSIYLSGEQNWLGPFIESAAISGNVLSFSMTLGEEMDAVVDYDEEIHGYHYDTAVPVIQVFLNSEKSIDAGYRDFSTIDLKKISIDVAVKNMLQLELESDAGRLNAAKAFLPFGPQPGRGSRLQIGCPEALSKKLSELKLELQWKGAPSSFKTHYANYSANVNNNSYFTADFSFNDAGGLSVANSNRKLFNQSSAASTHEIKFSNNSAVDTDNSSQNTKFIRSLSQSRSSWAQFKFSQFLLSSPVLFTIAKPRLTAKSGFISVSLNQGFLHKAYRKEHTQNLMTYAASGGTGSLTMLNEPYTPEIQSIKLSYMATSGDVDVASTIEADYANQAVEFYHLAYFGQMREHAYQRKLFDFVQDKSVSLMPNYNAMGELLIGLKDLSAGDSISILFQLAEGSANPELAAQQISWSVLCDNYWKPLGSDALVSDATNHLLTSGLIKFVIPVEATVTNSLLDAGLIWLKASLAENVDSVCKIISITANAIEVEFIDQGNSPEHLSAALPASSITKFKNNVPEVKKLQQPYASFGGATAELDDSFYNRVSERLRHKNRAVSSWDYERIILQEFPSIHKVKCIPHSRPGYWSSPGHVTVVTVPDLVNKNAIDPLQPRMDSNTLAQIKLRLQQSSSVQVEHHVTNPSYQKVRLDFAVKFNIGYEFNFYKTELHNALLRFLSPWAYDSSKDISFGGKIYKSVIIDFIEELKYVDYVTDFKLYSFIDNEHNLQDVMEVSPEAPDAILVSDASHRIVEAD